VKEASAYMDHKTHHHDISYSDDSNEWDGEVWDVGEVEKYSKAKSGRCIVLVDGFVVDVTSYLGEHVRFPVLSYNNTTYSMSCSLEVR
jgi:stearoyl-CoA desaturase (Delta-9 desaturase)